jgi:hypothetical protein
MTETIQKYSKMVASLIVFAFAAIALFWGGQIFGFHIEANFEDKVMALLPLLGAVVAVLATKNATEDAVDKAVSQFLTGLLAVAQFFHTIPAGTGVKIGAVVYALIGAVYLVWRVPNKGVAINSVDPPGSAGMLSH